MSKKIAKKAKKMARESIYDDAEYRGQWNGFDVYEPTFNDDKEHIIGIPQFILVKDGTLRWTKNTKESFAIMSHFGD